MLPLAKRGAKWFRAKLPDAAAETIAIRADGETIGGIEAIPGHRDWQQFTVAEATGNEEVFDWIVVEQDLVFPTGGKKAPASGWEFRVPMHDGRTSVFVCRPEPNTKPFERVDQYGIMYRVHTKFDRFE